MNELFIYEIPQLATGVVKARSKNEATEKVENAYSKHNDCFKNDEILIYEIDDRWFPDCPDVLEVYDL